MEKSLHEKLQTEEKLKDITQYVMKLVNKTHNNTNKITNLLGSFNEDFSKNSSNRLNEIKKLIQDHAIGVQRVYDEMQEIKKLCNDKKELALK